MPVYIVLALLGPGHARGTNASLQGDVRTLKEVYQRGWYRCNIDLAMNYHTSYTASMSVMIYTIVKVLIKIHGIFKVISRHLTVQYRLTWHRDTPMPYDTTTYLLVCLCIIHAVMSNACIYCPRATWSWVCSRDKCISAKRCQDSKRGTTTWVG